MAGFNFNLRKVLKEAAECDSLCKGNFDTILDKADLEKIFEKTCSITEHVAQQLKEQMCNPDSLRIVYDESAEQFFMDYNELINFCEASGKDVKDAVDAIVEHYQDEYDNFTLETFNIVFPQLEAFTDIMKGSVGYQDIAWSSHFLSNCINKGLKCTVFVDPGQKSKKKDDVDIV